MYFIPCSRLGSKKLVKISFFWLVIKIPQEFYVLDLFFINTNIFYK
jgi:hypothetical protein